MILSGATTPGQSIPGSDGNKRKLRIPQSSSTTGALPSDCLLGESYPYAEKQSMSSEAPDDWASLV